MQDHKPMLKGFLLGVLLMILMVVAIGAVNHGTSNRASDTSTVFRSVYSSQDGKIVYVCDDTHIYRSTDAGDNWTVILKKSNNPGS
jgi:photosystem II stability/assembly factor-like uncharacterized protein